MKTMHAATAALICQVRLPGSRSRSPPVFTHGWAKAQNCSNSGTKALGSSRVPAKTLMKSALFVPVTHEPQCGQKFRWTTWP